MKAQGGNTNPQAAWETTQWTSLEVHQRAIPVTNVCTAAAQRQQMRFVVPLRTRQYITDVSEQISNRKMPEWVADDFLPTTYRRERALKNSWEEEGLWSVGKVSLHSHPSEQACWNSSKEANYSWWKAWVIQLHDEPLESVFIMISTIGY